jgi:serine/threonine-protein kinase
VGEAHLALAIGFDLLGQTADALRAGEASIERTPSLDEAHFVVGRLRSECGEVEEGLRRLKLAARLDAKSARTLLALARTCELSGDAGGADAWLALADARAMRRPEPALFRLQLASWRGDARATTLARDRLATVDASDAIPYRALALFSDDGDLAVGELAAAAAAIGAPARYHWEIMQLIAEQQAQSGDRAGALSAVKSALAAGCADFLWLDRCGALEPIRSDPAFATIRTATRRRVERALKDGSAR